MGAIMLCMVGLATTAAASTSYTWTASGDWYDSAKWTPNGIPAAGDDVTITSGTILLTNSTPYLASLTMDGGTMTSSNWSTRIRATNVVLNSGSTITLSGAFFDVAMSNRVHLVCSNFTLAAGASIDVGQLGYQGGTNLTDEGDGQGGGTLSGGYYGGGGGYGGKGGDGKVGPGGVTNGLPNAPISPGSGGGGNAAGDGGGAVRIEATGTVTIDGTIDADGQGTIIHGGAGSGGGIFISCAQFQGAATGQITANGANSKYYSASQYGGGGGGGRIAIAVGINATDVQKLINNQTVTNLFIYDQHATYSGSTSVTNGTALSSPGGIDIGYGGDPGTVRFLTTSSGSQFWLTVQSDPGAYDSPTPYGYGLTVNIGNGTRVTNTVTSPFDEGGGLRRGCLGWAVTNQAGAPIASGSNTQAVFDVTTNMVLTFQWTNIYQLTVTSANGSQGSVNSGAVDGWYTNGISPAGIAASPLGGYAFNRWTGTGVPSGQETNNPLTTTMTEPRSLVANFESTTGETRTWTGTGNWTGGANWTPNGIPGTLDDAHIASGTVTLSDPQSAGSLTVSNGTTMVFTNWSAMLTASNVIIGGEVTLPAAFKDSDMSNRVHFVCTNLTLQSGGLIDGNGLGFRGGANPFQGGHGEGGGPVSSYYGGGGGYGGEGAPGDSGAGGPTHGVTNAPLAPGSGGGGNLASSGGGAVRIDASGTVTIDGTISMDAVTATSHGGAGSGGGIFISCAKFYGAASGIMRADGGDTTRVSTSHGGAGGGGRIAVAIGMTAEDVQKLIGQQPVTGLVVTTTYASYDGSVSASGGTGLYDGHTNHEGTNGTYRFLQVASPGTFSILVQGDPTNEGSPSPLGYGLHVNISPGTRITNTVTSPFDDGGGYGWGCLGWTVAETSGAPVANGSTTQAVFDVTTNVVLTYEWTNLYDLTVSTVEAAQGSVNSGAVNGWYTNSSASPNIIATASNGYAFNRWTGMAVPVGQETDNPLTVTMTQPRNLIANFASITGETKSWIGPGTWISPTNWSPLGIPGPQDDAHIVSGTLILPEPMVVNSLTVSNGTTLMFTNWAAKLTAAADIVIEGEVKLPASYEDGEMSNRVHFVCKTFTLASSGVIDVKGAGFKGGRGITSTDHGNGPGKGLVAGGYYGGGGGHGGVGGDGVSGTPGGIYDSTNAPMEPGSGGGGNSAGDGGGAVRIAATGAVTIDGTIDASGKNTSAHGGAGSGGSIFISCKTFQGAASGSLLADGGDALWWSVGQFGGGGGGGRISVAIRFTPDALAKLINEEPLPTVEVASNHPTYLGTTSVSNGIARHNGNGSDQGAYGDFGTLRFLTYTDLSGVVITVR